MSPGDTGRGPQADQRPSLGDAGDGSAVEGSHQSARPRDDEEEIVAFWSRLSRVWDPMLRLVGLHTRYRREAISVLGLERGQRVLDVACGTGLNFRYLSERVGPEGHIIAVDIAPGMLERARIRARKEGHANVEFVLGDISKITTPMVDAVAACWCMISITNYQQALRNVVSSLRPGGRICILDFKRIEGLPGPLVNPIFEAMCHLSHQDINRKPWLELERLLGNLKMREWRFGGLISSVYLAWGTRLR